MKFKAFFITIITLLAALCGAAQEDYVVFEGAEQNYFVEDHPGSEYSWRILTGLRPDAEANSNDYIFSTANGTHQITVQWRAAGWYYLDVIETDNTGCTNRKVIAVHVNANNRSIVFNSSQSTACYSYSENGFDLPIQALGDGGVALDEADFPVTVSFAVNGIAQTQLVSYTQQFLSIDETWFTADPARESLVTVQLTAARDQQGNDIPVISGGDTHSRTINAIPVLEFVYIDDSVYQNSAGQYEVQFVNDISGASAYHWIVDLPEGTTTNVSSINSETATITWDGPAGTYSVKVWATSENGCLADTIETNIEVLDSDTAVVDPPSIVINAGPDTTIGACELYVFADVFPTADTFTYLWEPALHLSDPTIANPVFTPEETSTYILTVSSPSGRAARDTVTITVSDLAANTGEDFMLEDGATALLNGTGSFGTQIQYSWTSENGVFVAGQQTASPEISSPGTYYLTVSDIYGCTSTDSVLVSRFISAPIVNDDYDTTDYQTSVTIDLLANDENQQGEFDLLSMQILQYPLNGTVDLNGDGTVTYTPNNGFLGGDAFQYSICNYYEKCDNAYVYVYVMAADFFIPEAFTPNGDNVNDFFEIIGIELFEQNSITIVNRWGNTVYKAQGYGISTTPRFWDGKSNQSGGNADLPTGTYFYVLDLGNGEQAIAGSVYIDR
ncbi:gliding motility-associated C-terminal domain-containing protein [uncultured Draconibacterium sp.]|uniref:T9SS type B sorting domain-containing protein n=1 Tax=uncultured Draconibacterium sp. TaxID=1573823 RepID=UPI0029C8B15F|nr:gliding motility-associated C-terminal domain-containing protein [uncultured Draconibacterium sp.]